MLYFKYSSHRILLLLLLISASIFVSAKLLVSPDNGKDYRDPDLSIEDRVEDLLSRMTLEEKVAQLQTVWAEREHMADANGLFDPDSFDTHFPHNIGQLARPNENSFAHTQPALSVEETVAFVNAAQHHAMENTRLGIPILMHEEALHGLMANDATSFPQAIALASSWDRDLVEQVYTIAGRETRVRGASLVLTPVLDVARDPRWGRVEETFGEDPYLVGEMGLASVRGFQGRERHIPRDRVASTLKHFVAHGEPEGGMNAGPGNFSERDLREIHMYPFKIGIREGRARAVMPAYNEIDGIPVHSDPWLLQEVLRDEWGFEGITVADYFAIRELNDRHRMARTLEEAAIYAIEAGVDMEMPDREVYHLLTGLVRQGLVSEDLIDRSVRRVLHLKFELGLFENPFADLEDALYLTGHPDHVSFAREVAEQSLTLLQNEGNLAPFTLSDHPVIAVIGPNADKTLLGSYSGVPNNYVTVLDGIRNYTGDHATILYAEGPKITQRDYAEGSDVPLPDPDEDRQRLRHAVETAAQADLVILALGGNEQTGREAWAPHHLGDRASLRLLGMQEDLVDAIAKLDVPAAAFIFGSRPLALGNVADNIPVVFQAWYLGQETGNAIANVLFGEVSPSGRLPVSMPRSVGHLPVFYNHKAIARRGYLFDDVSPLFPFGHGLSYTSFTYSEPVLSADSLKTGEPVEVSVQVKNEGNRTSHEVVQLYIANHYRSVTRPVRELKDFRKIYLEPGEEKNVTFTLTTDTFAFYNRDMILTHEPGESVVMIGPSSREGDLKKVLLHLL